MARNPAARAAPEVPAPAMFEGRIITPRIGAEWAGQGGKLVGIIKGEGNQPDYCLVAPIGLDMPKHRWGLDKRVDGARSVLDGMANTIAMAAAGSDMAAKILGREHAGHKDWYIAARNEARIVYANAPEVGGNAGWWWTSTQDAAWDDYAWAQHFGNGHQSTWHKDSEFPALVLRRVPIR